MIFETQYNLFKYQVILFDLSNAPTIFQTYVNKILVEKLDIFINISVDYILIYTENPGQQHIEAIYWVLDQLQKYSLFANLKKCHFIRMRFVFWGM